jgi:hypothetical protein
MFYLDCSCLNLALGIFPGIFGIFWVFFVPLNIFWAFPGFVIALKNISKKRKSTGLGRARGLTQPAPPRPRARQGPSRGLASWPGRRRRPLALACVRAWAPVPRAL